MPRISGGSKKKRSTGKGKPSRATGPNLEMVSAPTRGGMSFKYMKKTWPKKADKWIVGTPDPTTIIKNAIPATIHMGRKISPGTATYSGRSPSGKLAGTGVISKSKTKKGVPLPGNIRFNLMIPSSGPSVGSISQPIDQAPPRSYKAALAQNIAFGERQRMRPFPEAQQSPKNKRKKKAGRTTINYRI